MKANKPAIVVGYLASVTSVMTFIPQVWKTWESKSAHDLSFLTVGLLLLGCGLWTTYGVLIKDRPVWLTNGIIFILAATLLLLKMAYG